MQSLVISLKEDLETAKGMLNLFVQGSHARKFLETSIIELTDRLESAIKREDDNER